MKVTFDPPLKHEEATCAEIALREPTAGDVLKAETAFVAESGAQARRVRNGTLIAAVSGVSLDLVRKMPATQFRDAAAFVNGFDQPGDTEAAPNHDPQLVITLDPRIEKMGRIVDQIELREPTTGEVEEAQRKITVASTAAMRAMQIHLIALVAELPRPIIEAVPISKVNEASRYLMGFT